MALFASEVLLCTLRNVCDLMKFVCYSGTQMIVDGTRAPVPVKKEKKKETQL